MCTNIFQEQVKGRSVHKGINDKVMQPLCIYDAAEDQSNITNNCRVNPEVVMCYIL